VFISVSKVFFQRNSVWRPLIGPNDDWPLALCDYTSIDTEHDITVADLLHVNRVGENQLLYRNEQHKWYFIEGQQLDDLMVFRNVDSTGRRASKHRDYSLNIYEKRIIFADLVLAEAFHCAFFNPHSQSVPRHSCEVRFVAFR